MTKSSTGPKDSGDTSWWRRMYSELRKEVVAGEYDGILKGEAKDNSQKRPEPAERVYPANEAGRAEQARDRDAKQSPPGTPSQKQVDARLPESKIRELVGLCAHIRPGARVEDIDALAGISDGLLSVDRLTDASNWASGQMPCSINVSQEGEMAGLVRSVTFQAIHHDPEGVAQYGSAEALLDSHPNARPVYQTLLAARAKYEYVDVITPLPDISARIEFQSGKFQKTQYASASKLKSVDDILQNQEKDEWAKVKATQALQDAYNNLSLHEKLAQFREPRNAQEASVGVDGCLRDWAARYSSWGESPNRWASFANWLITESTPDDRHALAAGMNWDHGFDVFHWIIRQPDTDVATAALIIWQGGVSHHVPESAKAPVGYDLRGYDLLLETADRIRGGFYKPMPSHTPIGFEPLHKLGFDLDDPAVRAAADLLMPDVVRSAIAGRKTSELKLTMPERYWEILI